MAGIGFLGHTFTFNSVAVTHLTSINNTASTSSVSQIVADSAAALTIANPPVTGWTISFAVPSTGGATLLEALAAQTTGNLVVLYKSGIGGSTLVTWTAGDALSESQGVSTTASGGAFLIATVSFTTNGGTFT